MTAPRAGARVAGILWVITIATGVFAEFFVRAKLIVPADPAATARNILENEAMYRLGYAAEFFGTAAYLALTAILYRLFAPVNRTVSLIAAFFSIVGCTIGVLNLVNNAAPLLFSAAGSLPGFDAAQTQALAFAGLVQRREALNLALTCFGVQCLLIGILTLRTTFLPRLLGLLLVIGGAGYLVSGFAHILVPPAAARMGTFGYLPGIAAEAATALWLLLVGVNGAKWKALERERAA